MSDALSELMGPASSRGTRMADWLLAHSKAIVASSVLLTALLALPMLTLTPDTTASQMPSGEVVETQELVSERFVSPTGYERVSTLRSRHEARAKSTTA